QRALHEKGCRQTKRNAQLPLRLKQVQQIRPVGKFRWSTKPPGNFADVLKRVATLPSRIFGGGCKSRRDGPGGGSANRLELIALREFADQPRIDDTGSDPTLHHDVALLKRPARNSSVHWPS